jgi:hypothetical protein
MTPKQLESKTFALDEWMRNSEAFEEDEITEVTPELQIGSKIRTKRMKMQGVVTKIGKTSYGADEVFFRTEDGREMKTPMRNVVPIEKLQDGDGGGIGFNRAADQHVVNYQHVLGEIMDKYMQMHTAHQGPERRAGPKPEPVPGLNREKAQKIADAMGIRLNDTIYVYKLVKGMTTLEEIPPVVRMAIYNLVQGMPTTPEGTLKPYVMDKLKKIVAEQQLREEAARLEKLYRS